MTLFVLFKLKDFSEHFKVKAEKQYFNPLEDGTPLIFHRK